MGAQANTAVGTPLASLNGTVSRIIEVPRTDWAATLDAFSGIHEGWLVTVSGGQARGSHTYQPLVAVAFVPDPHGGVVGITVAADPGEEVSLAIRTPRRIWLERTSDEVDVALGIVAGDGTEVVLAFRKPVRPEMVDGAPGMPG